MRHHAWFFFELEMALQLQALAALPEDGDPMQLPASLSHTPSCRNSNPGTHYFHSHAQTHMQTLHTNTELKLIKWKLLSNCSNSYHLELNFEFSFWFLFFSCLLRFFIVLTYLPPSLVCLFLFLFWAIARKSCQPASQLAHLPGAVQRS